MAEEAKGQRFSFQDGGRLGARIGNQGATQTQGSTQSTGASDTSGVQSSGVFLPGISNANVGAGSTVGYAGNREKMTYIASNEIQGMGEKGVSEIQTPKTNIPLPGITIKPLEQVNKEIDDKYKRIKAENTQLAFIDAQEKNKQYGEQVNSEIGTQFEQGARQRWNNVKKAGKGAQSLLLERMAQIGYVNGAFGAMGTDEAKKKSDEWINDARNSNLEYKKKINEGFKKWQKENVNQDLVKEYSGKTFTELARSGDTAGLKYKTIGMFADNISLLPNIVVTAINTPVGLTLMGSDTFIQESQNGFDEMIENGATYEEARNGAMWIGALNAGIEMAGEELFGIVGPASKGLRRLFLKNAVKEIEKNVTKKTLPEIILRAGGAQLKSALGEGGEEVLQEIVTNAFVNTVNKDKSLLDNLWQSFEGGAVMGLLIPGGALNSVTTDVQNNKIIDQKTDLEALDYVLQGEKRKAQRIEQQKEKMRQRANEKFQAQAGENAGLSDTNDYTEGRNVGGSKPASETTTEESVNTLDEGNVESDGSTFFSTDENGDYVVYDDGNGEQKIYAGSNSVTENGTKKSQFTELSDKTPYDPELEEYSKNFQRLVEKLSDPNVKGQDFVVIGITEKGKEVRLSKQALKHIIEDHGKINVNTLLKAINKPSKQRWETKTDGKNRPYIVLDLGSKNKEFLVGLAPDSWTKNEDTAEYYTVTTSREAGAPKTPARDTRFQLKYEEEGYTPGVAGKNEKNISGKEGVNLRNKLNKKTVKELAEKYGIKVEVIEGMIKILENGKRKGYAYGKYIDQLLTLSEQIKESTAPHELLHAIFDMIDPETKTYLISQIMKSEGWSASKAEERLADSFSNFFRTGKIEGAPKSTWGKIKIFFKRVRSFINGMGKWRNQLDEIFTDIIESEGIEDLQGKIDRNERINKAKERMRERFKQYQKNAQKMQKKAESENKYQRAYHGSPADFDKFDSSHMGEGEGAQAHGWGHYVAVEERTGKHYAEIRPQEYSYKGVKSSDMAKKIIDSKFDGVDYLEGNANAILNKMQDGMNFEEAKKQTIENYKDLRDLYEENEQYEDLKKINKEIDFLKNIKESDIAKEKRNLYEVEIPDPIKKDTPTGKNYFEEDSFVNKNAVNEIVNKVKESGLEVGEKQGNWKGIDKMVDSYMTDKGVHAKNMYHILNVVLGSDKQASKFLESLGYDGIHYFGGRDGEAYVIFNDDALEIKNHEKYQKADIDPEATSPEDLIEVNDKGLDVMVKFVSEKQKKNATDVNKELLTDNGNPYMWTSTNKYKSKVITDWRNVEDSKYKEYTDKGIQVARFTNNSSMSYSYADYKSKLAPVKKFKSIDELNKFFKENPNNYERILGNGIDDGVLKSSVVYEMKENDGKFELISNSTETLTQSMKDFYDGINNDWFGGNIGEMPENKDEALKKLQEYYNEHDYEIDGERTVKLLKNGNVERTVVKEPTVYKRFNTKLDALAEGYTIAQEADLYHYQGVIQKMKNPLVVDIRSKDNTPSTWSRLGTVNDIFDKEGINYNKEVDYYIRDVEEAMDGFSERMKALEQYWNDAYRDDPYGEVSQFMGNVQLSANNGVTYMVDELEDLLNDPAMGEDLKIGLDTEVYGDLRDYGRTLRDVIIELRNFINTDRNYYALKKLSPEGVESWIKDMGAPKEVVKMIKNKNWKDMLGNWRDIGDKGWRENIKELLTTNGMDLETNDWVRYALDSGKYDGVIFKNIIDYGGLPKEGWENAKGGDVAVTFRSNQFKTWDNEDPTDSKYIRYQEMESDQKDNEGRTLSNGQVDHNKNSKIRDKKGNLLRVYHGTNSEYTVYDSSLLGASSGDLGFFGDGWYFATHKGEARYYGRNVMEGYLNITNPFYYGNMTKIGNKDFGNNVYVTIRNLGKIDESINNREIDGYKVSEIGDMVDDYLKNVKLEKLNDAKDPYNGWDITYWRVTEYGKSEIKTAMKGLSENGMLDEQLNHYMMDKVGYLKPRDLIEEMTDDARFDKSKKSFSQILQDKGYDGIVVGDTAYETDEIVAFRSNQFKNIDNLNPTDNEDIRYQTAGDINSEAFKKRFGNSIDVDENGNPKELYHGTVEGGWDTFDRSRLGSNAQNLGPGFYFTNDPKVAKEYTYYVDRITGKVKNGGNPEIKKVYVSIQNPLMWDKELIDLGAIKKVFMDGNNDYFFESMIPFKTGGQEIDGKILSREDVEKLSKSEKVDLMIKYLMRGINPKDYSRLNENLLKEVSQSYKSENRGDVLDKLVKYTGKDGVYHKNWRGLEQFVTWNEGQQKYSDKNVGTYDRNNPDMKYQKVEYEYDENGNPKRIKFGEDNEFDPSIFGTPTKEEQIEEDKENEKGNPFYDAWMKYNNQNYKDDQITLAEFMDAIGKWGEKQQEEYDQKMRDMAEAENDPKMLELQLKAVKLMEKEQNVGKKFGKNVSKEVRDRQQAEVEKEREELVKEIFDWMYPGLKFEDATYDDMKMADEKEAEWEMLGRGNIEEKLKFFKKDKNGNWEKKNIKIENPNEKLDKIVKSGNFDEIIEPTDRVIEWKTPEGQKGRIDKTKDPKKFKSIMEKINSGKTKTKVELKDVTNEVRALERYKENEKAEKERRKKEKQEEFAKKKQEEYKKMVRMKAFQRLVDMQRFEKYPFLTEEEIKNRYGFSDQEWKTITEQEEIKIPKKWGEKAISDFNKAVDDQVKALIEGLNWQNNMKMREAEKNLGEIGEIDLDVLLGKDEEKGAREVEEFERIAKEEKKKSKKEKNKRLEQAREDVTQVEIDKERENSKSEKERVDKLIKSTKTDKTVWGAVKKFTSDILQPVSTRIKEISPKIYRELMRYFQNKDILTNQRLKEIDPFLKAMAKIRKENPVRFMDIWVALANRNIGYANGLLQEYGVKVPTKLLDTIFDEAEDVGLNINYLGSYYPLSVKAPKSFLEELMKINKGDIASEIEKRIQQESQKKGGPLDESEITAIINSVIAGEEKGPDVNVGNKHLKKRNTEIERTPQMLEYCDDPISTLISYIEGMTQSIERAKFLGKSRSGNVHTLADYVYNAKNGLDPEQQDELMELLKSVFNDESPNKFVQSWRDLATLTTLGSPSSTLTQISDLSFSVVENGWRETLKAVWDVFASRKVFDLQDMGVLNRGEEYANINSQKNLLQKAIHNVFKLTFFSNFDTFGKSTFLQSTWNKRRKRALKGENGDPQLIKDIMKITDDEYTTMKIINDLRNGVFSEDVALVMYMKLGDVQPLTKSQMPKAYLDNPNGRLFYQFKTFGIKQLDYVLQKTKENTKGWKNLSTTEKYLRVAQVANMVFVMTLLGVGADELKDITMRRKSNSMILRRLYGEDVGTEQIWEKMEDNVLKLFGLSRYTVMQMKNDPVDAITSLFTTLPATNIVNYPFKDIYKAFKDDGSINWSNPSSYQLIPVVGKYRYWIYGGGQEKQQEALDKENKKKTTTSGGSSRSTRNTRSRSRNTRNSR